MITSGPFENLHITIILISITTLNPLNFPQAPLHLTHGPSLTAPPNSIYHHHPTALNLAS